MVAVSNILHLRMAPGKEMAMQPQLGDPSLSVNTMPEQDKALYNIQEGLACILALSTIAIGAVVSLLASFSLGSKTSKDSIGVEKVVGGQGGV